MARNYNQQAILKDLSQYSKIYLIPLSDFHLGDGGAAVDIIQGYIDWIYNHNNAYTILNGDLINAATKESSAELYDDLTTPDDAYAKVREMLYPIRNRILMITRGNHEEAIYRKVGHDYMNQLSYDLDNVPYKPDGGLVGIKLQLSSHKGMCWIYATHGWGGARTIGAKVKKAQDLMNVANADVFILSHDHTQNINRGNIIEPPRSKINFDKPVYTTVRRKLFVNTGGFIRYGGYIQRKGYVPQDLGTPRIRIEMKWAHQEVYLDLHSSI